MPEVFREGRYTVAAAREEAEAVAASVTEDKLTVRLSDGRTLSTPVAWYPRLVFATEEERLNFEIMPGGDGLHWPDLDEHLSIRGMLAGQPSGEGARSLRLWKEEMRRRRSEGISGPWQSANAASYRHDGE